MFITKAKQEKYMVFVHSFWSKPLLQNKFSKYQEMLPIILSNYAYSCTSVKSFGHQIKLYADKIGAELLSFIPYDEVIIIEGLENENVHFAAQIKFEALKRMSLDEYLIDGDLFLQHKRAFEVIKSKNVDFIYSFFEPNSFILRPDNIHKYFNIIGIFNKFKENFTEPYTIDSNPIDLEWPNTSFMKFNNQELKFEYIRQYEYFKNILSDIDFGDFWPDIMIEQRHMFKLLESGNYTSQEIIKDFPTNKSNEYACDIGFTHLGTGKKLHEKTIFQYLKKKNPVLYDKTNTQISKYINKTALELSV